MARELECTHAADRSTPFPNVREACARVGAAKRPSEVIHFRRTGGWALKAERTYRCQLRNKKV